MTQAGGSSRCGESLWLFLLGLYRLVKISIEGKKKGEGHDLAYGQALLGKGSRISEYP